MPSIKNVIFYLFLIETMTKHDQKILSTTRLSIWQTRAGWLYSGDLNNKLVQYLNGLNFLFVKWSIIQVMAWLTTYKF